jgi:hypothetical protein
MHTYSKEKVSFMNGDSLSNEGPEELKQQCVLKTDNDIDVDGTQLQTQF